MNGRAGADADIGRFTCKNASVVDNCICSSWILNQVRVFQIEKFDPVFSDIPCPITCSIKQAHTSGLPSRNIQPQRNPNHNEEINLWTHAKPQRPRWDPNLKESFLSNLSQEYIDYYNDLLYSLSRQESVISSDINVIYTGIKKILIKAAKTQGF